MTADLFNEPDACGYEVGINWPDGERSTFSGIRLTALQVAASLAELAEEIRRRLAEMEP